MISGPSVPVRVHRAIAHKGIVAFSEFPTHYALVISCCGHLALREEAQTILEHRDTHGPLEPTPTEKVCHRTDHR
jgi:hypothetical protein